MKTSKKNLSEEEYEDFKEEKLEEIHLLLDSIKKALKARRNK